MGQRVVWWFRNAVLLCGAVAIGLVVAELVLSVVLRSETDFLSHLRPGPYCEDPHFAISSACANRQGNMRILAGPRQGTNQFARYRLNQDGYRGPFTTTSAADQRKPIDVVLLGGASQGFGFGVNDGDTFPAVVARHSCIPTRVHSIAFVGLDNRSTWSYFQKRYAADLKEKFIILNIYWRNGYSAPYDKHVDGYRSAIKSKILLNKWIHDPHKIYGLELSDTFLFSYGSHTFDKMRNRVLHFGEEIGVLNGRAKEILGISASLAAERTAADQSAAHVPEPKHVHLLRDFLHRVDSYAKSKGARMGVLVLPYYDPKPRLTDDQIKAVLPPNGLLIDAHRAIKSAGILRKSLLDDHFSPIQTDLIGRTVAASLNRAMGCSKPEGQAHPAVPQSAAQ